MAHISGWNLYRIELRPASARKNTTVVERYAPDAEIAGQSAARAMEQSLALPEGFMRVLSVGVAA